MAQSVGWTSTVMARLKELHARGLSASEIGKKIGMTKNAVVGKLNRMGWNKSAGRNATKSTSKPAVKSVAKSAPKKTATKPTPRVAVKKPTPAKKPVVVKKTPPAKKIVKPVTPAKAGAKAAVKKPVAKTVVTKAKPTPKTPVKKQGVPTTPMGGAVGLGPAQRGRATVGGKSTPETKVTVTKPTPIKKNIKSIAAHQRIINNSMNLANLRPNQCRWPIGDPDSENFHFCGEEVFVGKPYCYEHCKTAYQFTPQKKS